VDVKSEGMYPGLEANLQNGDMIEVVGQFPFPRHVGIYASGRGVVHNHKSCCVQLTDLQTFSGGKPVRGISRVVGSWVQQEQAVQRALSLIGKPYNLLNFNCEHAAYYAQTGVPKSPQLGFAFGMLCLLGVLGVALSDA
jgi:uncharacterized protein YycO